MNYSKFCQYGAHIGALTKSEIENPYIVLDELCKRRNIEDFQKDLEDLLKVISHDEWIGHEPSLFYKLYQDLIRLIDVLWLINKYSPALGSAVPDKKNFGQNEVQPYDFTIALQGEYQRSKTDITEETENPVLFLDKFYDDHHIGLFKSDISNYVQLGLDASYMQNDKYEYFAIKELDLITDFNDLQKLIAEGYMIYEKGPAVFPCLQSCKEVKFAFDMERPTCLSNEGIVRPSDIIFDCFYYHLDFRTFHKALKEWRKMLYEENIWKNGGNPGNLLYFHECLASLIDAIWLEYRRENLKTYIKTCKAKKEHKEIVKKCNADEYKNPLLVIHGFFSFKKINEWKMLLEEWLTYSLSDSEKPSPEGKNSIKQAFNHLTKLLEVTYLLGF